MNLQRMYKDTSIKTKLTMIVGLTLFIAIGAIFSVSFYQLYLYQVADKTDNWINKQKLTGEKLTSVLDVPFIKNKVFADNIAEELKKMLCHFLC